MLLWRNIKNFYYDNLCLCVYVCPHSVGLLLLCGEQNVRNNFLTIKTIGVAPPGREQKIGGYI